jgi:hypothetical protein
MTKTMSPSEIANLAHADAARVLAGFGTMPMTDHLGCAEVAVCARSLQGAAAELYVDRFVGHCINVACGTSGR